MIAAYDQTWTIHSFGVRILTVSIASRSDFRIPIVVVATSRVHLVGNTLAELTVEANTTRLSAASKERRSQQGAVQLKSAPVPKRIPASLVKSDMSSSQALHMLQVPEHLGLVQVVDDVSWLRQESLASANRPGEWGGHSSFGSRRPVETWVRDSRRTGSPTHEGSLRLMSPPFVCFSLYF